MKSNCLFILLIKNKSLLWIYLAYGQIRLTMRHKWLGKFWPSFLEPEFGYLHIVFADWDELGCTKQLQSFCRMAFRYWKRGVWQPSNLIFLGQVFLLSLFLLVPINFSNGKYLSKLIFPPYFSPVGILDLIAKEMIRMLLMFSSWW